MFLTPTFRIHQLIVADADLFSFGIECKMGFVYWDVLYAPSDAICILNLPFMEFAANVEEDIVNERPAKNSFQYSWQTTLYVDGVVQ